MQITIPVSVAHSLRWRDADRAHAGGIRLIGAFKLLKGVLLILAAVGVFTSQQLQSVVWRVFAYWNERAVELAGAVTASYGLLFIVEGAGLLAARRWAEWLTVIATTSLIPLEVWKLARHATLPSFVTLAVNIAIVVYLAIRLRRRERAT